jgi:P4 family phage/plasmid primase-like protien|tara:strand:- start:234 stop:1850 length:1617 start_codon:yes stop_codon:yes gene_type:complete
MVQKEELFDKTKEPAISGWEITDYHKILIESKGKYVIIAQDSGEGIHNNIITKIEIGRKGFDNVLRDKIVKEIVNFNIIKDNQKALVIVAQGLNPLQKALYRIRTKKSKGNIDFRSIKLDNYVKNIETFSVTNPFFYDNTKLFWFWNEELNKYEEIDEIDLMNYLDKSLGLEGQTVSSGVKSNYIEAFKRVGRDIHPNQPKKHWIQFKDKAFSLTSKNIHEVTPHYFFTNPIPFEIGETSDTLVMDKLFEEWVGKDYVQTLYEIIAYCCYQDYPIHLVFCLVGSGSNGKSKFQSLLSKFVGLENCTSSELDLLLDSRFESFKIYKKMVCILGETNFGIMKKTSFLKKLCGQDMIGYEKKGKTGFDDFNYAKIIVASNALPTSEDTSEGFYRRWVIIDFPNQFPDGKDILKTIPEEEYNNLAKKVTEILPELLDKGMFTNQGTIEDRKKRYIEVSNPLGLFIEYECKKGIGYYQQTSDFYAEYCRYLMKNKRRVVTRKEFSSNLIQEGFDSRRTTKDGESTYFIEGIQIKNKIEGETIN